MSLSTETIDRIVANVLGQLGSPVAAAPIEKSSNEKKVTETITLSELVVTGTLLESMKQGSTVSVPPKAIITPGAADAVREKQLVIVRSNNDSVGKKGTSSRGGVNRLSIAVVQYPEALQRAISELKPTNKEMFGCPDDAAKFAISEVCRDGAGTVLVFAEQVYRAACFANRNSQVKAVAVADTGDVKAVRKQLRANVWCLDPTGRAYFELKNVLKLIVDAKS